MSNPSSVTGMTETEEVRAPTRSIRVLRALTSHKVRLFCAVVAALAALTEIVKEFEEFADLWENAGSEHGVLLLALIQLFHSLGDLLEKSGDSLELEQRASITTASRSESD